MMITLVMVVLKRMMMITLVMVVVKKRMMIMVMSLVNIFLVLNHRL